MAALWPGRSNRTSPDSVRGDRLVPLVMPIALLTAPSGWARGLTAHQGLCRWSLTYFFIVAPNLAGSVQHIHANKRQVAARVQCGRTPHERLKSNYRPGATVLEVRLALP
jgi:hypothetical protein